MSKFMSKHDFTIENVDIRVTEWSVQRTKALVKSGKISNDGSFVSGKVPTKVLAKKIYC